MQYRILFAGDLHKRMKDITTIRGYARVCIDVQLKLMQLVRELQCTHFISLGDWFDRGYGTDTAAALAHTDIDRLFAEQLNGNFYGVIGNHIRINMDSNPELFLIQPHKMYTSRHKVIRNEQIIKTPDKLVLNGVQISFKHYNKEAVNAADYTPIMDDGIKYHIALFHTPLVIPQVHLAKLGMHHVVTENSKVAQCLANVDLAIVGDIHKPLGAFKLNQSNGKTTTMIVPGSLTNTDAGLGSRHDSIQLPFVTIDDNGSVSLQLIPFDLMTNRLTFMKKGSGPNQQNGDKMSSLRGNNVTSMYEELEAQTFIGNNNLGIVSLNAFMKEQGYTQSDKQLIKAIMDTPEDIRLLIDIHNKADESLVE